MDNIANISETAFSPELCFEFPIYTVALKDTPRKRGLEECFFTDSLGILGSCQEIMPMTFRILIWKVMSYAQEPKRWYWDIMGNPPSRVLNWWHWVLTHPKSIWGKPSETSFFVVLEVTSQSVVQIRIHIPLGPNKGYNMLELLCQNVLKEYLRCPVSWLDILPFSNQPFTRSVFENASAISSARYLFGLSHIKILKQDPNTADG